MPIAYIDISFFSHATEDEDKVIEAAKHLLPKAQASNIVFDRSSLRGHHGNPITFFETKIREKDMIKAVVENLSSKLGVLDKETLLREINLHMEKAFISGLTSKRLFKDGLNWASQTLSEFACALRRAGLKTLCRFAEKSGCFHDQICGFAPLRSF